MAIPTTAIPTVVGHRRFSVNILPGKKKSRFGIESMPNRLDNLSAFCLAPRFGAIAPAHEADKRQRREEQGSSRGLGNRRYCACV